MDKEMMKGSIDLVLLSLINQKDLYGYEIIQILKDLSENTYEMSEGTLYAALKRMERKALIESYWEAKEGTRRKYYTMTTSGQKELKKKEKNWLWMAKLVERSKGVIKPSEGELT